MQTLFLRRKARSKIKAYTHTLNFGKFSEWYTNKNIKNALEMPAF